MVTEGRLALKMTLNGAVKVLSFWIYYDPKALGRKKFDKNASDGEIQISK